MTESKSTPPRIVVALDYADPEQALRFVAQVKPQDCRLKVGKELFTRAGPALVERLVAAGFDVFLDLKFHDIPNTVAKACAAAADLGVWMVNVHALGGRRMMEAAREAIDRSRHRPLLIAVTVLTSATADELHEVGLPGSPEDNVMRLASLASQCGLDGVVCSPREASRLRAAQGRDFLLVTPGVRPQGAAANDQRRTATPLEARRNGADYLVIGRPVTAADNPLQVLRTVESEISDLG